MASDPLPEGEAAPPTRDARLVEEATKKAGLVWLHLPGVGQPRAAWHLWRDGAAYLVADGLEQPLPGLVEAGRVAVTVPSKDKGGRLVTWIAAVSRVEPGTEEWDRVVPLLHAQRLNAPDGEEQPRRWARESVVVRLDPTGEVSEVPEAMPQNSDAAPPVPTTATTAPPLPYVLGRRRRRR
ncbi:MAG: hypothetical protein GEV03_24535 [Streptosporangiales bacterium]|nr:hypothetical protein [Streptosporangiales bacterium]